MKFIKLKLVYAKIKLANGVIFEEVDRKNESLKYFKDAVCNGFDILLDLVLFVMLNKGMAADRTQQQMRPTRRNRKKTRCVYSEKSDTRSLYNLGSDDKSKGSSYERVSHYEGSLERPTVRKGGRSL
jgi:hypothetical protein